MKPKPYQRFFAELKRRRVFNSAALYGGVAFVVFQAADFVLPALRLSESVATGIVVAAVVLFPVAMVVAWFYDFTAGGMRRTEPPTRAELDAIVAQPIRGRWPVGIAALVGVTLLAVGVWWEVWGSGTSRPRPLDLGASVNRSIEILPFLSLSGDESLPFLSEGIADELSSALMRVPGLKVVRRVSEPALRTSMNGSLGNEKASHGGRNGPDGTGGSPQTHLLLEGSVDDLAGEIEISILLLGADDGEQRWRGDYRLQKERFLVELDGVARDLAGHLGVDLPREEAGVLIRPWTDDFQAYCDYLMGRNLAKMVTPGAIEQAIEAYHRALILDPDFGRAWSALATAYVLLPEYGGPPIPEVLPYAQSAAHHALASEDGMAEGIAASGFLKWSHEWDFQGAEEDFQRSIQMDPLNPTARYWLTQVLTSQRRWEEAREQVSAALELDPRSPVSYMTLGLLLMCEGTEGAEEAFRHGLELAPEMHPAAFLLGALLALEGDLEEAAIQFDRFSSLTGDDPALFHTYLAALSDPAKIPEAMAALDGSPFFGPTQSAALLAHLGERELAFTLLDKAAEERSPYLLWANALPHFSELRSDPRFQGLMAWVGF